MFKSRLQDGLKHNKVAFAGEYALVSWGCGIGGCVEHTFVSKKTGQVIEENIVGGEVGGSLEGIDPIVDCWLQRIMFMTQKQTQKSMS